MVGTISFRNDGTLTIMHLTDYHWIDGGAADRRTLALTEELIAAERPDLIVLTGDIIHKRLTADPLAGFERALAAVVASGIPWAFAFGNHDLEAPVATSEIVSLLQRLPNSLFEPGPASVRGHSNYVVPIRGSRTPQAAALLYLLDSGAKTTQPFAGSAWIDRSQIGWYAEQSAAFTAANGGAPLPALAFFHIPLPEYNEVWDFHTCYGSKNTNVSCPKVNSGLFAAMVEMGDVLGTFVGHNHHNDFYGDLHGIRLGYSRLSGYGLGREEYPRGARIIRLHEGVRRFETWQRLDDGSVLRHPPEHPPEAADPFGKRGAYPAMPAKRIVDVADDGALPKRFRMTTAEVAGDRAAPPDWTGFKELRASGSGQFSLSGLRRIKAAIGDAPLTVVDLRQESHGFVDGLAVSWFGPNNGANKGLTDDEALRRERRLLDELQREPAALFDYLPGKGIDLDGPLKPPFAVLSAEELVRREGHGYVRFPVTDHHRPPDETVDAFIRYIDGLEDGMWLHFHCRGGVGRTSTFMLMYDMLRHAGRVGFEHMLQRHRLIGGRNMRELHPEQAYKYDAAVERLAFIERFHAYCVWKRGAGVPSGMSWSAWLAGQAEQDA